MAVNTWDGSTDTDWDTAANWTTTGVTDRVPTSADNVVIANVTNKPVIGDGLNPTVLSIEVETSSQLTCGANTITCTSERSDYAFNVSGTLVPSASTLVLSSIGSDTYIKVDNGTLNHLTINSSGDEIKLANNLTVGGNLTITAGELDILGRDLTVTGELKIDGGTLTCNDSDVIVRNIYMDGGTLSAPSNSSTNGLEVTGEGTTGGGGDYSIRIESGTITHNNGTLALSADSNTFMRLGNGWHDFIIRNDGSSTTRTHEFINPTTINGDFTLTNGSLQSYNTSWGISVTGNVLITKGQLGRSSAAYDSSFGSLTIAADGTYIATSGTTEITDEAGSGYCVDNSGTFTHNSGTLEIGYSGTSLVKLGSSVNNVTLRAENTHTEWVDNTTIAGDLIIVEGLFRAYNSTFTIDVNGDVSIESGGTLGHTGAAQAFEFGSLTIASGGTYIATSGTTTITSMTSTGSGDRSLSLVSGGTFTNNSGTVLFNSGADQRLQMAGTGNLYNLTVNKSDNEFITFGNLTILNNLDVTLAADHTWRPNAGSDTLTVYGNTYLTTGKIGNTTQYTGTNNWGNVTINSGEFILSTGTNNVSGIRNVGGTVSQS